MKDGLGMSDNNNNTSEPTSLISLRELRAGPITALFDATSGFLRKICIGNVELLRGICGAVRDRDWGTVTPIIEDLVIEQTDLRFKVRFNAKCRRGNIDFHWRGTISCNASGRLEYTFDGVAHSNFLRNRIGLCVLHPIAECAGKPCVVAHTDGSMEHSAFPARISPHQPFFNLRSIAHEAAPGIRVETLFHGDVFEMEDQRNWTDASFKTYSTPLAIPFPVAISSGASVHQSVIVKVSAASMESDPSSRSRSPVRVVEISLSKECIRPRPSIGVEWIPNDRPSRLWFNALRDLAPDHLRVELRLAGSTGDAAYNATPLTDVGRVPPRGVPCGVPEANAASGDAAYIATRPTHVGRVPSRGVPRGWRTRLDCMRAVAEELPDIKWHAAVFLGDSHEAELQALATELSTLPRLNVSLFLILPLAAKVTSHSMIESARQHLQPLFPFAEFAAGTDAYCAELNRDRPEGNRPALPCFSINPQVHAFDDLSLMETLAAQSHAVETVADFTRKPVVISPVTLLPRSNPNATSASSSASPCERDTDPRQTTAFCAAWTLGTLSVLATHPLVHSITLFELDGSRGFFRLNAGTDTGPEREKAHTEANPIDNALPEIATANALAHESIERFPCFHVLRDSAGYPECGSVSVSEPDIVAALRWIRNDGKERLALANLTPHQQIVRIQQMDGRPVLMPLASSLNAARFEIGSEWTLRPYEYIAFDMTF